MNNEKKHQIYFINNNMPVTNTNNQHNNGKSLA